MKKTRKKTSGQNKMLVGAAVVLTAALLLGGTFAWQSINSTATGERESSINPGGRLHYDLSGWEATPYNGGVVTEDVYVENFGNQPIVARVRLAEFMEIGTGAGLRSDEEGYYDKMVDAIPVWTKTDAVNMGEDVTITPSIDDKSSWRTHIPSAADGASTGDEAYSADLAAALNNPHTYWKWTMGGEDTVNNPTGQTVYMPTFNKNKDSLAPDINGSMDGGNGGAVQYSDWVNYQEGDTATRVRDTEKNPDGTYVVPDGAFWDADDDTEDEGQGAGYGNGGIEGTDFTIVAEQPHVAKLTEAGGVVTMAKWDTMSDQAKKSHGWWVYDTDGWAYWSQPIYPGTATGVLLDKVEPTAELGKLTEQWYYAIHAEGQFVTLDDVGRSDDTGFFTQPESGSVQPLTFEAEALLESIGVDFTIKGNMYTYRSDTFDPTNGVMDQVKFVERDGSYKLLVNYDPNRVSNISMARGYSSTWTLTRLDTGETATAAQGTDATLPDDTTLHVEQDGNQMSGESYVLATLTLGSGVPDDTKYKIEAHAANGDSTATVTLPVRDMNTVLREMAGTKQTVWMDGHEWYVLAIDDEVRPWDDSTVRHTGALMLSKDAWSAEQFSGIGTTDIWNSDESAWKNLYAAMSVYDGLTTVRTHAISVSQDGSADTDGTQLFLLSEADLFGTTNGQPAAPSDYTVVNGLHKALAAPGGSWATTYAVEQSEMGRVAGYVDTPVAWWTRTKSDTAGNMRVVSEDGSMDGIAVTKAAGVRPAFWYDLGAIADYLTISYNRETKDSYAVTTSGTYITVAYGTNYMSSVTAVSSNTDKFTIGEGYAHDKDGPVLVKVFAAEGVTDKDWADITVTYTHNDRGSGNITMTQTFVVRGSSYQVSLADGNSYSLSNLSGGTSYTQITATLSCPAGYDATTGAWSAEIGDEGVAVWNWEPAASADGKSFSGTLGAGEGYEGISSTKVTFTFDPNNGEPPVSVTATVETTNPTE